MISDAVCRLFSPQRHTLGVDHSALNPLDGMEPASELCSGPLAVFLAVFDGAADALKGPPCGPLAVRVSDRLLQTVKLSRISCDESLLARMNPRSRHPWTWHAFRSRYPRGCYTRPSRHFALHPRSGLGWLRGRCFCTISAQSPKQGPGGKKHALASLWQEKFATPLE